MLDRRSRFLTPLLGLSLTLLATALPGADPAAVVDGSQLGYDQIGNDGGFAASDDGGQIWQSVPGAPVGPAFDTVNAPRQKPLAATFTLTNNDSVQPSLAVQVTAKRKKTR